MVPHWRQLRGIKRLAFDKTGTLTQGKPKVTAVLPLAENEETLLMLAASLEQGSSHPLAKAIIDDAHSRHIQLAKAEGIRVLNGRGMEGTVAGRRINILAPRHVDDRLLDQNDLRTTIESMESGGNTVVIVSEGDTALGLIGMADTLRDDAVEAISKLKAIGVDCIMLTGDNRRAAAAIAGKLGIDYQAELLPEDKVEAVRKLQAEKQGSRCHGR